MFPLDIVLTSLLIVTAPPVDVICRSAALVLNVPLKDMSLPDVNAHFADTTD